MILDCLDEWLTFQQLWIYLDCVFFDVDIQIYLPREYAKFNQIDKIYCEIMQKVNHQKNVATNCNNENLLNKFKTYINNLNLIHRKLEEYLNVKRGIFPRFYFLSNDELILILSQASNIESVQKHINKCFDNISKIKLL